MNILIVLDKTKNASEFNKKHELLLKHAENWGGKDNDVYILTNIRKRADKLSGIHFVNPPKYLFNNFLVSVWFSMVNHPRFDFVIEEVSFTPFVYRKPEKIMYISSPLAKSKFPFGFNPGERLIALLIKTFFKKSYFLTSSWQVEDFLRKLGIESQKIHLIRKGLYFGSKKRSKVKIGKNLLFIADYDIEKIKASLSVFKMIERRDLDWSFSILVPGGLMNETNRILSESDLSSRVSVVANKSQRNVFKEIAKTNLLLDLATDANSLRNDMLALGLKIPVIAVESNFVIKQKELVKSLFLSKSQDYFAMAQNALEFPDNERKYQKKVDSASDLVRGYTWKSLSDKSLDFLENMRL
jgi:hypothetical protein